MVFYFSSFLTEYLLLTQLFHDILKTAPNHNN